MRKLVLAFAAAAATLPTIAVPPADAQTRRHHIHRYHHVRCHRGGTAGALIGGGAGALAGAAVTHGAAGPIIGAAGGALLGRHIAHRSHPRCR